MSKTREMQFGRKIGTRMMVLMSILVMVIVWGFSSIVSHAESQAKVLKASANIRQTPDAGSLALGSVLKDDKVSIVSKTTGADGNVWYKVFVNADSYGYIRSDLVSITDGTTPPDEAAPQAPANNGNGSTAGVEAVNPTSATVTGGQVVRVRSGASTSTDIVTTVQQDTVVTVTGKATDSEGKVWYQISFNDNGNQTTGFLRSDYASLSGELSPLSADTPVSEDPTSDTPAEVETTIVVKDYETKFEDAKWYLYDNQNEVKYSIDNIIKMNEQNKQLYEDLSASQKSTKSQKTISTILLLIMALMAGVIVFLIYKIRDISNSAYINAVEKETIRRRNEAKNQKNNQKIMQSVGEEKKPVQDGQRPAQNGQRPAQNGQRPAQNGQRPAQNGQRPVQNGQRPAQNGQRPVQNGQRPAQNGQRPVQNGQRPAQEGQRPAQSGQRPVQNGQRSVEAPKKAEGEQRQAPAPQEKKATQNPNWKAKNFMEDDEFEFEFLNWDGEEDN